MFQSKQTVHFLFSACIALASSFLFFQTLDVALVKPNAFIGIASFTGVDVGQRIQNFYTLLFVAGISFLLLFLLVKKLPKIISHEWILPLSVAGIFCAVQSFINPENFISVWMILGILFLTLLPFPKNQSRVLSLMLLVSISLFIHTIFVFSGIELSLPWMGLIWIILISILSLLFQNNQIQNYESALFPLVSLPLLSVLANESFLIFNQRSLYFAPPIGWLLIYLLIIVSWVILRKKKMNKQAPISESWFGYLFVFSIASFAFYSPYFAYSGDLFEMANPANAMMRHFVFDELPFIDYFSSHVLYEQITQWLYVVMNGYHADLSFMIYTFLIKSVGVVIGFWFLKTILSFNWALLILFAFPYIDVLLPPTFIFGLLSVKFIYAYFTNRNTKNLYFLLLWVLGITLWRIDFGAAIIPAISVLFILDWLQVKDCKELKNIVIHVSIFLFVLFGIAWVTNILNDGKLFENLPLALDYLGASQAHGYTEITKQYSSDFYVHYYAFPLLATLILIGFIASHWRKHKSLDFLSIAVLYLGLIYLFNAQRGLVRHGFNEEYDLYISSVFFLFIATWITTFFQNKKGLVFLFSGFFIILGFHFPNVNNEKSLITQIIGKAQSQTGVKNTNSKINRVIYMEEFEQKRIGELTTYLNQNLDSSETFIDFSHSPMLYFFAQRRVPSYFNQYVQNTVTPKLLHQNVSQLKNIGLVVFGHSPRNLIDILDGVPNELRYLPLTEYIYGNFSPHKIVANYRIWMPKRDGLPLGNIKSITPIMKDNLMQWPKYLGSNTSFSNSEEVIISGNDILLFDHTSDVSDAFLVRFKSIPENAFHQGWIQYMDEDGTVLGQVQFDIFNSQKKTEFVIPIGYQYNWSNPNVTNIQFFYPEYLMLDSLKLVHHES